MQVYTGVGSTSQMYDSISSVLSVSALLLSFNLPSHGGNRLDHNTNCQIMNFASLSR